MSVWFTRRRALLAGAVVAVVAVLLGVGAWVWLARSPEPAAVTATGLAAPDPAPRPTGERIPVGPAGGSFTVGGVEVAVPGGAVDGGITLQAVARPSPAGGETFGAPIGVEHDRPLGAALTIRWTVADLPARQRAAAVLVRWNPDLRVWASTPEPLAVDGDRLVAQVREFSFITWVTNGAANLGQAAGELFGKRAAEPKCARTPPHRWVKEVVRPDADLSATAIRTCTEPDRDEIMTVRVTNNRTFAQRLRRTDAGSWAWTWPGPAQRSVATIVYDAARAALDTGSTFLAPPMAEVAVGVGRPGTPGQTVVTVRAEVDALTVFADVGALTLAALPIGGLDNPLLDAFAQALFECGGKQLVELSGGNGGVDAVARAVVQAAGDCARELMRPASTFGARYEALVQRANSASAAKAHRFLHEAAGAFRILEAGDIAFYVSDQFANALVGPVALTIRGDGKAPQLGAWKASCADGSADTSALYKNLALQDAFLGNQNLSADPQWRPSARTAVRPLDGCPDEYLHRLADALPGSWADRPAAGVVAEEIRALTANPSANPNPCAPDDVTLKLVRSKITSAAKTRLGPAAHRICEAGWMYTTAQDFLDDAGIWSDGYHVIVRLQNGRWTAFQIGGTGAFFIGEDDAVCNPLPPKIKQEVCVKAQ
jgi:hypothetical protein